MNEIKPVQEKNRYIWIDAARGIAIFGIFIVNIGTFSSPYFLYGDAYKIWTSKLDQFILNGIDIFFQASFYTLFSILFGFGLGMMKDKLIARGSYLYSFLSRRMVILLLFGTIHGFLLWHGDILFSYALIGLLSLFFLKIRPKIKMSVAAFLLGGSVTLITLFYYVMRDYLAFEQTTAIKQSFHHYLSNDLYFILTQNFNDWLYANNPVNFIFLVMILLPLFLIGIVLAEKRWLHEPEQYNSILLRWWGISFLLFIGLKFGPYAFGNPLWFSYVQDNIGGTFSAIFYIFSITLMAQSKLGKKMIEPFAYVGRMALTNYIIQSFLCFFLFYGIGFGLYGSVRPTIMIMIVIIIYFFQVIGSKWWFQYFQFGPLEWIWRSLTYGKIQPFKIRKE